MAVTQLQCTVSQTQINLKPYITAHESMQDKNLITVLKHLSHMKTITAHKSLQQN